MIYPLFFFLQSPLDDHLEGLMDVGSDELLTGPHMADTTIEEVGILKTPAAKSVEVSLRPSTLLEEIRQGKMKVGGKDIKNPPSRGGVCSIVPSTKATSMHTPLKISEPPLGTTMKQVVEHPEPSQWVGENVVSNFF